MKLLSNSGDRIVFYLTEDEVEILSWAVGQELSENDRPIILSRAPKSMPNDAEAELRSALKKLRSENQSFLKKVLQPNGPYLKSSAGEKGGYGLILTREELERVFQASNDVKLRHWEALGCPDDSHLPKSDDNSEQWASYAIIDLANQVQMILLHALGHQD